MNLTYKVGTLFSFSGFSFGTNEDFIAKGKWKYKHRITPEALF
jgi:hypothetical protein